jgi:hypothetical protein
LILQCSVHRRKAPRRAGGQQAHHHQHRDQPAFAGALTGSGFDSSILGRDERFFLLLFGAASDSTISAG